MFHLLVLTGHCGYNVHQLGTRLQLVPGPGLANILHSPLHYHTTSFRHPTLHSNTLHSTPQPYSPLHHPTLHSTTLHSTTLHSTPPPYTQLHHPTINSATLHSSSPYLEAILVLVLFRLTSLFSLSATSSSCEKVFILCKLSFNLVKLEISCRNLVAPEAAEYLYNLAYTEHQPLLPP